MSSLDHKPKIHYVVGYRKPPKANRFSKGVSGNPRGRPRKSDDFFLTLTNILRELISINDGTRRRVTKLEAILIRFANRVASGDLQAIKLMSRHLVRQGIPTESWPEIIYMLPSPDESSVVKAAQGKMRATPEVRHPSETPSWPATVR